MTTRSSAAKKTATRIMVDDDDDFVDKIPIIQTRNLVKTTAGRVYRRLCDEEILVGKTGLKVTCFCNLCVGSTTVKGVVSALEMAELKNSAFGIFFKLGKIKWVNGQLLILLALNHVEPINKSGEVDRLNFHIGDRIVEFKKTDFALITGLRFGRESRFEDSDLAKANDISTRYFNGKMSVSRIEVENVFKGIANRRDKEQLDAVKLALLNIIVNHVESGQWDEMVATTSEKAMEKIAMLFALGDSKKDKGNNGSGERVDESYGAGRRKLKGKLHWGCDGTVNHEEINVQRKEKRKMRMEVTKLRIAFNAHTRLLNGYISRKRNGKQRHSSKKRTTADNSMPSFDLGFESQENNDGTEHDVADDVWQEDINMDAEIGTQPGLSGNDLHDPLNDISTQEVEGRWLKSLHGLGLGKDSEKNGDKQECDKVSLNMVKDVMQSGNVGKDVTVEDVPCTGVDRPKEASPMNGQENDIEVDVAGFTDKVETASQVIEAIQDLPEDAIFSPVEENLGENYKNPKDEVLRSGTGSDLLKGMCEEVKDSKDDDEVVNEEPCTQIVASGRKYKAHEDVLDPSEYKLHYGEEDTLTKTWYYNIFFSWGWLSDTHLDVIFYYLRMKGVEFGLEQRYTTTDTSFLALLKTLCGRYMKKELTIEEATRNKTVRSTIMGGKMEYARPWQSADFVYMPLNTGNHWTLLVLDIKQKLIRSYDSSTRRNDSKRKLKPFLPCLQMFLPKIMDKLGVYDGREEGPVGDDVIAVEDGSCCPQQNDGSSCGMFVVKMAEFLMMGCDVGDMDDHEIAEYRKKMTVELLAYCAV
ncbi:unnamed protein product [Cuscuta campestris]|uniref:Ubiquitin-like protease family profile domain-containing protein n=1 Tax=Cuscuta campestris TaxID=132261 RepID=A0A484NRE9_9ASTE|nr:unnamed protein product [Cuscuta campestris]